MRTSGVVYRGCAGEKEQRTGGNGSRDTKEKLSKNTETELKGDDLESSLMGFKRMQWMWFILLCLVQGGKLSESSYC